MLWLTLSYSASEPAKRDVCMPLLWCLPTWLGRRYASTLFIPNANANHYLQFLTYRA
jgi:hypothetical protein